MSQIERLKEEKYLDTLAKKVASAIRSFERSARTDDWDSMRVLEVRVVLAKDGYTSHKIIVKAISEGVHFVAFDTQPSLNEGLVSVEAKIENNALKWHRDKYANPE